MSSRLLLVFYAGLCISDLPGPCTIWVKLRLFNEPTFLIQAFLGNNKTIENFEGLKHTVEKE